MKPFQSPGLRTVPVRSVLPDTNGLRLPTRLLQSLPTDCGGKRNATPLRITSEAQGCIVAHRWKKSGSPFLILAAARREKNRSIKWARAQTANFANAATPPAESVFAFANQINVDSLGWAQLAPFGDYPGQALIRRVDGSTEKFDAIQRLDPAAAQAMVAQFKSPWNRLKRYFTGCPIFVGHPDVPAFANDYADKNPKGMIVDLQVRADGLYCRPVFTEAGSELVENRQLRALSAYWSATEVGRQTDTSGQTVKIFRPEILKSAGLTNHPNLPVQRLDGSRLTSSKTNPKRENTALSHTTPNPIMDRQIIINILAAQGIAVAADATDDQLAAGLQQLGDRAAAAETALANHDHRIQTLTTELANERHFHIDRLLEDALGGGRITAAQKEDWATRLQTDFANESAALAQLAPILKTTALTLHLGARKAEIANASDRRDVLDTLVKTEMTNNGGDYDRAFAVVQKTHPALFSAMKQPAQ